MNNITKAYKQLQEGTMSKSNFVRQARMQFPQYISPVSSYQDIVSILKSKRILTEAQKLTTDQIIDRLSPYAFKKGMAIELEKEKKQDKETYEKVREKVAKKLQNNPKAYDEVDRKTEKQNDALQMKDVKKGNFVDKPNQMKSLKKDEKANVKASKKENKKGKPKGVKQLKEGMFHDYHSGREVETPDGPGVIETVTGGTLTVKLESGQSKDYQINVIDKAIQNAQEPSQAEKDKQERAAFFSKMPDIGTPGQKFASGQNKLKEIVEKIKSILAKKKIKAESGVALKDTAGNIQYVTAKQAPQITQAAAKNGVKLTQTNV